MYERMVKTTPAVMDASLWQEMQRAYRDAQFGYAVTNNQVYFKHVTALLTDYFHDRDQIDVLTRELAELRTQLLQAEHDRRNDEQTISSQRQAMALLRQKLENATAPPVPGGTPA